MKTKHAQSASLKGLEVPGAVLRPFASKQLMLVRAEGKAGSPWRPTPIPTSRLRWWFRGGCGRELGRSGSSLALAI